MREIDLLVLLAPAAPGMLREAGLAAFPSLKLLRGLGHDNRRVLSVELVRGSLHCKHKVAVRVLRVVRAVLVDLSVVGLAANYSIRYWSNTCEIPY